MRAYNIYEASRLRMLRDSPVTFEVTDEHLKLLDRMYVSWDDCEFGAPAIDCKRPYGNSDVLADIAEILDLPGPDDDGDFPDDQAREMTKLHAEMATVLQIGICAREFKAGRYVSGKYGHGWAEVTESEPGNGGKE